jgi:hypothetical protein
LSFKNDNKALGIALAIGIGLGTKNRTRFGMTGNLQRFNYAEVHDLLRVYRLTKFPKEELYT